MIEDIKVRSVNVDDDGIINVEVDLVRSIDKIIINQTIVDNE